MRITNEVLANKIDNVSDNTEKMEQHLNKINGTLEKHSVYITKLETRQDTHSWFLKAAWGALISSIITLFFIIIRG